MTIHHLYDQTHDTRDAALEAALANRFYLLELHEDDGATRYLTVVDRQFAGVQALLDDLGLDNPDGFSLTHLVRERDHDALFFTEMGYRELSRTLSYDEASERLELAYAAVYGATRSIDRAALALMVHDILWSDIARVAYVASDGKYFYAGYDLDQMRHFAKCDAFTTVTGATLKGDQLVLEEDTPESDPPFDV